MERVIVQVIDVSLVKGDHTSAIHYAQSAHDTARVGVCRSIRVGPPRNNRNSNHHDIT